jgi:hypothetical protein
MHPDPDVGVTASGPPPEPSTGGEHETKRPDKKRSREVMEGQTERGPATSEAGPSRLTVVGYPQPVRGHELLVLAPMRIDLYEQLTPPTSTRVEGSTTEPETSEEEMDRRKKIKRI